jgi:uncharacterized protein (TIGR02231 family)
MKVVPALSHSAYLVAEARNTGPTPILRGQAHLFAGPDLVGQAEIPTTGRGGVLVLPLGIDDAIRVERNVKTVSSERGVFSRLDVSAYDVAIELLNTRTSAMAVRVFDEIPLASQSEVAVALDAVDPPVTRTAASKDDGGLEWELNVAPGARQTVHFRYEFARPKGWKPTQTWSTRSSP